MVCIITEICITYCTLSDYHSLVVRVVLRATITDSLLWTINAVININKLSLIFRDSETRGAKLRGTGSPNNFFFLNNNLAKNSRSTNMK